MKTRISIAFLAGLSLAAAPGCGSKKNDCASAMQSVVATMMAHDGAAQMPPEAKAIASKMQDAMAKACVDDHWSADVISCLEGAKSKSDLDACKAKLTPEQQANAQKAMASAMPTMGAMMGAAMAHAGAGSAGGAAQMAAAAAAAAAPVPGAVAGDANIPKECQDYKATVDKLVTCKKLPQVERDAAKRGFDALSASWGMVPDSAKAQIATSCKNADVSLKKSVATTCGW